MPGWLSAAQDAYAFVDQNLRDEHRRLAHAWREGRIGAAGMLDDYASIARAALALFEATGLVAYLEDAIARTLAAQTCSAMPTAAFFDRARRRRVPAPARHPHDGATPSGVGLMAEVLARLHHLTGEPRWRDAAERLIRAFTGAPDALPQSPLLLVAADFLERGIVVVVAKAADEAAARALVRSALASPDPATCVLRARVWRGLAGQFAGLREDRYVNGRPPPMSAGDGPAACPSQRRGNWAR